jgi:ABC-type dipeptide/oligopeptide/nickel transport system permease subunit
MSGTNLTSARFGHWYLVLFPGIAISLVVLAANLLGDALRDILDPRLRH